MIGGLNLKKAVIFDMDGVLIDSEKFYFNRRMKYFDEIGIEPASRKLIDFVGLSDSMIWEKLVPKDEEKRKKLKAGYIEYRRINKIKYKEVFNPSAKAVIEELSKRKIKIAIASSSEKKEIYRMIQECNLEKYIEFYISGEECERSKPCPEIYLKALGSLGVDKEEALAIEDSSLGIEAGKAAELKVIALEQEDCTIDQSKADYKIKDLKEILDII